MMKQKQFDEFNKCVELLEAGYSVDECLQKYPGLTAEMKSLLIEAKDLIGIGELPIPEELVDRSRVTVLSNAKALSSLENKNNRSGLAVVVGILQQWYRKLTPLTPLARKLVLITGITGLLILFSSGLVITSAKSLPGDSLYSVKRVVEDISIHIVPNHEIRNEYEDNYSHQRVVEVQRLLELNRIQPVAYEGILEAMDGNNWMVSGIPVTLNDETVMIGGLPGVQSFEIGSIIEVEGKTTIQRKVLASEIHLREYKYIGTVEKIGDNTWQISGNQVFITPSSQIDPGLREGDDVTLLVRSEDNGIYALAILHDIRLTPIPFISPMNGSTDGETSDIEHQEELQLTGSLEKINSNYWVVDGEVIFIANMTDLPENIQIGDLLSIKYRIELNGSYTAVEIEKIDPDEINEEFQPKETPGVEETMENHEEPEVSVTPPEQQDDNEGLKTPEIPSTPEPTEDH